MSTNSEPDLNIILRKSLNKSSGNIQMIVMLLVTIIVKMMVVMKIMIMKVSIVSIVSNYIYTSSAFALCKSIELDIQKHFAQKCPTFLREFPILHL